MNRYLAVFALLLSLAGCQCTTQTQRHYPKLEIPDESGNEVTGIDFGTVPVDVEQTVSLRVRNAGTASLTLSSLSTAAPFGSPTAVPVSLGVNEETQLVVSFKPTVPDLQKNGTLVIASDDPDRAQVTIALRGMGVQAVAIAAPNPIDFQDVYHKEVGTVSVTLTNAGSSPLSVLGAALTGTPATVTGDTSKLVGSVAAGGTVSTVLSFAPTRNPEDMGSISGALVLTLDPKQGGSLSVPIRGRGIVASPRLCFKYDSSGIEQCTDPQVAAPSLQVRFPGLCDNTLFPPDSGSIACTTQSGQASGRFYFRNEGNVQVAYTVQYMPYPYGGKDRCDAGLPPVSDFTYSNSPSADGGLVAQWSDLLAKLPTQVTAAKPWETQPINVVYRATSRCAEEATDIARVVWTRQNDPLTRTPGTILMTIDGNSNLPRAVASSWSCGSINSPQKVPCQYAFFGVNNAGTAPLRVTSVELYEEFFTDGGSQDPVKCEPRGLLQACQGGNPFSDCERFGWANVDGGDPNQYAPHLLPGTDGGAQPTQKVLGQMVFGPNGVGSADGGATPNRLYRVFARVHTDDPYNADVLTCVQGVAMP